MSKAIAICLGLLLVFLPTAVGAASLNFFECWPSASAGGPPYPTEALKKNVYLETGSGALEQTSIIGVGVEGVEPAGLAVEMTSHNGGGGTFSVESFFDVFYYDGAGGDFPADSFFDVFVEIDLPDGSGTLMRSEPTFTQGDSFFDVFVEIDIDPAAGTYQVLKLRFEVAESDAPEPTSLTFNGRGIDLNEDTKIDTLESFFDVWFELGASDPSAVDSGDLLVSMTLTGEVVPEPVTLALVALGGSGVLGRRR
jgi:hypothetical protein